MVKVRFAKASDYGVIKSITRQYSKFILDTITIRPVFQQAVANQHLLVIMVASEVCGYVFFYPHKTSNVCTLYDIVVTQDGLGLRLLSYFEYISATKFKKRAIRLKCSVRNIKAINFYHQNNYRVVAVEERFNKSKSRTSLFHIFEKVF